MQFMEGGVVGLNIQSVASHVWEVFNANIVTAIILLHAMVGTHVLENHETVFCVMFLIAPVSSLSYFGISNSNLLCLHACQLMVLGEVGHNG